MVERSEYLAELQKWQDEKVIKVVTGLRRCGKSTLLSMFQERLLQSGVGIDPLLSNQRFTDGRSYL